MASGRDLPCSRGNLKAPARPHDIVIVHNQTANRFRGRSVSRIRHRAHDSKCSLADVATLMANGCP